MKQGYIKLYRKIQEHPFYKNGREYSKLEAWLDILLEVNHTSQEQLIKNTIIECGRGQSTKSLETWQKRWNWQSKGRVRDYMILLQKLKQISYENLTQTIRITVINYDSYQGNDNANKTELKREQNASRTEKKPNKNGNELKNDKNDKYMGDENFKTAFKNFKEMRIKKKKPMTDRAVEMFFDELDKLVDGNIELAIKIIDQSIYKGWDGIFELKQQSPKLQERESFPGPGSASLPTREDKFNEMKQELQGRGLPPAEYEKQLKALVTRFKL